jgi:hypothetical protein
MRYIILIMVMTLTGWTSAWAAELETATANAELAQARVITQKFCHVVVGKMFKTAPPETDELYASLWLACTHSLKDWLTISDELFAKAKTRARNPVTVHPSVNAPSDAAIMALYEASAALQAYGAGFQGQVPLYIGPQPTPFGAPNSIGPYGTLGPTWQSFNGYFQPTPQQQIENMLAH